MWHCLWSQLSQKNQCKTPEKCRNMELSRRALSRKLRSSQQDVKPGLCPNTGKDSVYFLRGCKPVSHHYKRFFSFTQKVRFQTPDLNPNQISSLLRRTTQRVLPHSPTLEFVLKNIIQLFPQHNFEYPASLLLTRRQVLGASVSSEGIKICSTCVPSSQIHKFTYRNHRCSKVEGASGIPLLQAASPSSLILVEDIQTEDSPSGECHFQWHFHACRHFPQFLLLEGCLGYIHNHVSSHSKGCPPGISTHPT